jgi:invasion protein IalB
MSLFIFFAEVGFLNAQDNKTKAQETPNKGPDSTSETFGDWAVVCGTTATEPPERVCEVDTNVMIRGQTAPSARVAIGHAGKEKSMRIVTLVPVNVSIPQGVSLTFETGKPGLALSFKTCAAGACFAEADLTKDQLAGFRAAAGRGTTGQVSFADPSGKQIPFEFSLKGFEQAVDSWQKH